MNRVPRMIQTFKQLGKIGDDILLHHKYLANSTQYDMKWKSVELSQGQEEKIEEFCKLADSVTEDWGKHHTDINKYWTGLS